MTDTKKKPNVLYYSISPLFLESKELMIEQEKEFDFTFENISTCTDDLQIAKEQLGTQ